MPERETLYHDLAREDADAVVSDPVGWVMDAVVDFMIDPVNREAVVNAERDGRYVWIEMADGRMVSLRCAVDRR